MSSIGERIRGWIWDTTTSIVADTIALVSPATANVYRYQRAIYKRAYVAASTKGPYSLNRPSNVTGDREVGAASSQLRAKVRDMVRNNPLVAGMLLKRTTAVIGDEIGLKAQIADAAGKPMVALNAEIERRFYAWAEAAMSDGGSLTDAAHLIENHLFADGEVLVKDTAEPGPKGSNPYRVQVLEADHLDTMHGTNSTGIDYASGGKPVAYWLTEQHPGGDYGPGETKRHDAADICHLFERDRASQGRGASQLAPSVFKLWGIDDLEDAEIVASRAACAFGLIVETPTPEVNPFGPDDGETEQDDREIERKKITAGGIFISKPGEKVTAFKNERPNSNFDSFIRGRQRNSASAVGLSYETSSGDYSQVNYSSARMGRLVEWANIRRRQARIKRWLNRVFRKWLSFEVGLGIPGLDRAAYNREPSRFWTVSWQLAGNDGIDPVKEITAFENELALGVNSRTRFAAERGRDFAEVVREQTEEKAILKAAGLYQEDPVITSTTVSSASVNQTIEPGQDDGDKPEPPEPPNQPDPEEEPNA